MDNAQQPPDNSPEDRGLTDAYERLVERLAGQVQAQAGTLGQHGALITGLAAQVAGAATREHVEHVEQRLSEQLAPIQRGIQWTLGIILSAVLLAILAQVLKGHAGT